MKSQNLKFKVLEHTADLKIQAWGKDLPEVFVNLAKAVASQQGFNFEKEMVPENESGEKIKIKSSDLKTLLIDWLNELLYLGEKNEKIYSHFEVLSFSENKIEAKIFGQAVTQKQREIKAATFHDLQIGKVNDHWEATVLFDI